MKVLLSLLLLLCLLLLVAGLLADQAVAHPQDRANLPARLAIPTDLIAAGSYSVTVPVAFAGGGNAVSSITFSIDFDEACLSFDDTDANNDGRADVVRFDAPAAFRSSVSYDAADHDGELDVVIADYSLPITSLPDLAELMTIRFTAICIPAPGARIIAPVGFSTAPVASFGAANGVDVAGATSDGFVTIQFDALPNTATATPAPTLTPTLTSTPTPGASTVTPTVTSTAPLTATPTAPPITLTATPTAIPTVIQSTVHLAVADRQASPGATAMLIVTLNTGGNQIAAATFALGLDRAVLHFDPADADADGIPDAMTLDVPSGMNKGVTWNGENNRLEVALFGLSLPLPTLTDGTLATITVTVSANTTTPITPLTLALVSFSDPVGKDLPFTTIDGILTVLTPAVTPTVAPTPGTPTMTPTPPQRQYLPIVKRDT